MTLQELSDAVVHLGFSSSLEENDDLLREAATRALADIAVTRPRYGSLTLYHLPPVPLLCITDTTECRTEMRYDLPYGASYFLRLFGSGTVYIRFGEDETSAAYQTERNGVPAVLSGVAAAPGPVTIRIVPAGGNTVLLTLAVYAESEEPVCDPMGESRYVLQELAPDFAVLDAAPTDVYGTAFREGHRGEYGEYRMEGQSILCISNRWRATLKMPYRKKLVLPESGELPISPTEESRMTYLCAAYVWLDDDAEKAAFYFARAREAESREPRTAPSAGFYNVADRWG